MLPFLPPSLPPLPVTDGQRQWLQIGITIGITSKQQLNKNFTVTEAILVTQVPKGEGASHTKSVDTFTEFRVPAGTKRRWWPSLQLSSDAQLLAREDKIVSALCHQGSPPRVQDNRKPWGKTLKAGACMLCCSLFCTALLCWFNSAQCCCFGLLESQCLELYYLRLYYFCHLPNCDILNRSLKSVFISYGCKLFSDMLEDSSVVDAIKRVRVIIYNCKSCSCSRVKLI